MPHRLILARLGLAPLFVAYAACSVRGDAIATNNLCPLCTMTISISGALRGSQGRVGKIIVNFIEFHIKCSNEYIFVLPLANLIFRGYVRSGRWVGEVSQTKVRVREKGKYTCEKGDTRVRIKGAAEKTGTANQYQSVRHYAGHASARNAARKSVLRNKQRK